jgi:hypothetical protein
MREREKYTKEEGEREIRRDRRDREKMREREKCKKEEGER